MIKQAILHTDGGSRGNPGPSGIGFVILVDDGKELVTFSEGGAFIGNATNNVAEYQALIWGLANAVALKVEQLDIRADSELLVKQIKGEYKVKNEGIKPLYQQVRQLLGSLGSYQITHVYREDNARADALANEAMDAEESVGSFEVACVVVTEEMDDSQDGETEVSEAARAKATISETARDTKALGASAATSHTTEPIPFAEDSLFSDILLNSHNDSKENDMSSTTSSSSGAGIYSLTIKNHFDAAHALVGYPGECKNLHGHTWDIEATVSGTRLDEVGIVYDFKDLKTNLMAILDDYDHKYLNEVPPFDKMNATAENLAREIFERLEKSLPEGITLDEVAVWESPIAKLTYRKG